MLAKVFSKSKTKHKVIVITDQGHMQILPLYQDKDGKLETATGMYPKNECQTFLNELDGGLVYTYHLTHDAYVEAQQLKNLQKSVVLGKIFKFDTKSKGDFMALLPWIGFFLVIMFK